MKLYRNGAFDSISVFPLVVTLLLFAASAKGGTVRVSFLTERAVLQETVAILNSVGCGKAATLGFKEVVDRYNATALPSDFGKFPQPRNGFYSFESVEAFVAALPHKLCDTWHAYEFNCFDTVIMLAGDRLRTGLGPDEVFGPFLVAHPPTNGAPVISVAATARDAFTAVYPAWYRETTESSFPKSLTNARMCFTAAFFRWYVLPMSTTEAGLSTGVMDTLRAGWKGQKIGFPASFEVVLCHEVRLPQHMFATTHAGLLIRRRTGWIYLEKAGGTGPFVRFDFVERNDLTIWLSAIFAGAEKLGLMHHFATFNNKGIEVLKTSKP